MKKIGFIGAGQMARALACAIASEQNETQFCISDPNQTALESFKSQVEAKAKAQVLADNQAVAQASDVLIVAVKPQYISEALASVQPQSETLVISVVAGVMICELERMLGTQRIVRVMPNTPCLIGQGASAMAAGQGADPSDLETAGALIGSSGLVLTVSETQLDAVTGLSGSGPGYVFTFIEAMIDGGVLMGLPRDVARQLAIQTVAGAAQMMAESGEHPGVLRDRVTSPGGTTIAGLKAMEETGFRDSVMSAVTAATERSRELGS